MSVPVCVLDASAGVKWFRNEAGSERARELLRLHVAAGLADLLDAPLYSADARAHAAHPRVELLHA